ncbi:hypothetical protein HMPREF9151_00158 [Hoylesella saccharolytica F0055]|uniref:Uncharacterized protein n=1 Tax=Hoylesella saccharolytica F0055 TaxID=1127699 RepID=L1NL00_9BACT|nr:hypothetical protein HMPREF9151_00158 [Hoylesella saccharolytica F0055]
MNKNEGLYVCAASVIHLIFIFFPPTYLQFVTFLTFKNTSGFLFSLQIAFSI